MKTQMETQMHQPLHQDTLVDEHGLTEEDVGTLRALALTRRDAEGAFEVVEFAILDVTSRPNGPHDVFARVVVVAPDGRRFARLCCYYRSRGAPRGWRCALRLGWRDAAVLVDAATKFGEIERAGAEARRAG